MNEKIQFLVLTTAIAILNIPSLSCRADTSDQPATVLQGGAGTSASPLKATQHRNQARDQALLFRGSGPSLGTIRRKPFQIDAIQELKVGGTSSLSQPVTLIRMQPQESLPGLQLKRLTGSTFADAVGPTKEVFVPVELKRSVEPAKAEIELKKAEPAPNSLLERKKFELEVIVRKTPPLNSGASLDVKPQDDVRPLQDEGRDQLENKQIQKRNRIAPLLMPIEKRNKDAEETALFIKRDSAQPVMVRKADELRTEIERVKVQDNTNLLNMPNDQRLEIPVIERSATAVRARQELLERKAGVKSQILVRNEASQITELNRVSATSTASPPLERVSSQLTTIMRKPDVLAEDSLIASQSKFKGNSIEWDEWYRNLSTLAEPALLQTLEEAGSPAGCNTVRITVRSSNELTSSLTNSSTPKFDAAIIKAYKSLSGNPQLQFPPGSLRTSITVLITHERKESDDISGVQSKPLTGDYENGIAR